MTHHTHLTFEVLDDVEANDPGQRRALKKALAMPCARCLTVLAEYLEQLASPEAREPASVLPFASYSSLWPRIERRIAARAPVVQAEIDEAYRAFDEIAHLPAIARQQLFATQTRFATRAFVDRILDAARASRLSDPAASLAWATNALTLLDRQLRPSVDQRILALALRANALRAPDDYPAATDAFACARALAEEHDEELEPNTLAELDSLEASLHLDLRCFDEAEGLLVRSLEIYRELGEETLAGRGLIKLGYVFYLAGDLEAAIAPYEAALEILTRQNRPDLHLVARFNLALTLVDLDRIIEARDLLTYDEDLYAEYADDHLTVRRAWLEGRVAAATGKLAEAENLFVETRDTFVARADGFDAALVSLDLALLYHRLDRSQDLLETVSSAIEVFAAYTLHREALAALIMLRDAIREEAVTAEAIEWVASLLRRAAQDPTAHPRPAS